MKTRRNGAALSGALLIFATLLILSTAFAQTVAANQTETTKREKKYHFVVIEEDAFSPDNLFIFMGDCVVWSDLQGHNVIQVNDTNSTTPLEGGFSSDLAQHNETAVGTEAQANATLAPYFMKCFDVAGIYHYISNRNASLIIRGVIVVMTIPEACDANQTVNFIGTSLGLNLTAPISVLKVVDNIAGGDLASAPSSASWLVLGLKNGEIQYFDISTIGGTITPNTLLTIPNILYAPDADATSIPMRGLLGLAFDPMFNSTGRFFVHYTAAYPSAADANATATKTINCLAMNTTDYCKLEDFDHIQRIAEYKWANATSTLVRDILVLKYPFYDHVGKNTLEVSEEGHLIVSIGDGGCARNDPFELAQNDDSFLGKIWRVDIGLLDYLITNESLAQCVFPETGVFNLTELNGICANYSQIFYLDSLGIRSPAGFAIISGINNLVFLDQLEDGTEINIANGVMQNFGWPLVSGYQCRIAEPNFQEGMCMALPMENSTMGNNTAIPAANVTTPEAGANTTDTGKIEFYIKVPASVIAETYVSAGAWFGYEVECPLRGSFLFARFGKLSYLPLYAPDSYLGEVVSLSEICSLPKENATEPATNATTVEPAATSTNETGLPAEIPSALDERDQAGDQIRDLTVNFGENVAFDAITALTASKLNNDIFVGVKVSGGSYALYRVQKEAPNPPVA